MVFQSPSARPRKPKAFPKPFLCSRILAVKTNPPLRPRPHPRHATFLGLYIGTKLSHPPPRITPFSFPAMKSMSTDHEARKTTAPLPYLKGLSDEQRSAVLDPAPRMLVLAGAGSGKTRVLVARAMHGLLTRETAAGQTALFSFTRKACAEIQSRIQRLHAEIGITPPRQRLAWTFNGFAHHHIRMHAEALGFTRAPCLLREEGYPSAFAAFSRFLHATGRFRDARSARSLFNALSPHPRQAKHPDEQQWLTAFHNWKIKHNLIEFRDHIPLMLRLLTDPHTRARMGLPRVIMVDEFQDVDPLQATMLRAMLGPDVRLTLFGDDDQAIYRWRGSDPRLIREFEAHHGMVTHILSYNFRSDAAIVRLANRVIAQNPGRRPREARAFRPKKTSPICLAHPDQAQAVARLARARIRAGCPPESMAVLVRERRDIRRIGAALSRFDVPWTSGPEQAGIRIATRHAAKGLEFAVVILPFLDHISFPQIGKLHAERLQLKRRLKKARRAKRRLALRRLLASFGFLDDQSVQNDERGHAPKSTGAPSTHRNPLLQDDLDSLHGDSFFPPSSCHEAAQWIASLQQALERFPDEFKLALEEERRLFYVSITRARDELYMICARKRAVSPFLNRLGKDAFRWKSLEALERECSRRVTPPSAMAALTS